jgi:hypothetical protein
MRGNRTGALEASGIIDISLEGQSGNRADKIMRILVVPNT